MKRILVLSVCFFALIVAAPFVSGTSILNRSGVNSSESASDEPSSYAKASRGAVRVLALETGEVKTMSVVDYLTGCLFAQIPINYGEEALKAQALAARTFLIKFAENPPEEVKAANADISDGARNGQSFWSAEKSKEFYGDDYREFLPIIRAAAEYAEKKYIAYKGEPIYAVYSAVSNGSTNDGANVWNGDYPYLKSVPSAWDASYKNYSAVNELTIDAARLVLLDYDRTLNMPVNYALWFADIKRAESGYVTSLKIGDKTISGGEFWRLFNLRSASFDIRYDGDVFLISTEGVGSGAGLSQFGADYMSAKGYSAEEIVRYYFTDVEVLKQD